MMAAAPSFHRQPDKPTCPDLDVLKAFVLGKLSMQAIEEIGCHLADCKACKDAIDRLDAPSDSLIRQLRSADEAIEEETAFRKLCRRLRRPRQPSETDRSSVCQASPAGIHNDGHVPSSLGQYELHERIGQGAMGTVYRAWHIKLKREVALKLLSPKRLDDAAAVDRFAREMEAIGKLDDHPNIVRARDAAETDGYHFLVMDYVDGADAGKLLAQLGPLGVADGCEVIRQAALGLEYACRHGIVHRDIKPSNLMVTMTGQVKILDLGLVAFRRERRGEKSREDAIVGTADYMAPEQWSESADVDIRTDIYSLGCTLFKLLLGRAPYASPTGGNRAKMRAHRKATVPHLADLRPEIPAELDAIAARMLAKKAAQRFARPRDVAAAIAPFAEGSDLARLAERSRIAYADTDSMARDPTDREWGGTRLAVRRWPRALCVGLLLAAALTIAVAWSVVWRGPAPDLRLLLSQEPESVLWDDDRARRLLHAQATGFAFFRAGILDGGPSKVFTSMSNDGDRRAAGLCRAALENRHVRGASKSTVNRMWANVSRDYTKDSGLSSIHPTCFLAASR